MCFKIENALKHASKQTQRHTTPPALTQQTINHQPKTTIKL